MTITFGPPSYNWDGGVQSLFQKEALTAFYHLLSIDSGPALAGVSVTGTTQQTGYQIAATNTWFSSVVSGGTAVLPETSTPYSLSGVKIYVTNTSPTVLTIFANPADAGNSINGSAPNVGYALPGGTFQIFHCYAPGLWLAAPLANFTQTAGLIVGGSTSASTLTLESTSGTGTTDFINFKTGSQVERIRIDTNGNIITGGAASFTSLFGDTPGVQINVNGVSERGIVTIAGWTNDFSPPGLYFTKSRNTTIGGQTAVQAIDQVGFIGFGGSDGAALQTGAAISATVEGTVAGGSVPLRLVFFTGPNSGGSERMRIDSVGSTIIGGFASLNATVPFQIISAGASQTSNISLYNFSVANNQPDFVFANSQSNTYNGQGAMSNGAFLARIMFYGSDGTALQRAAMIRAEADATFTTGHAPGNLKIFTSSASTQDTERMRIDSTGQVIVGGTSGSGYTTPTQAYFNVNAVSSSPFDVTLNHYTNDAGGVVIQLYKSRATTIGGTGVVSAASGGDQLGAITFYGDGGSGPLHAGAIQVNVDGTPSGSAMPSRLTFFTVPSASTTNTERLRITSAGSVMMSAAALSTSATDGFLYINSCAGAPTGAPTAAPGAAAAMVIDTTNSKIWVRIGGTWKGVVVA